MTNLYRLLPHCLRQHENTIRQLLRGIVERYGSRYSYSNLAKEIDAIFQEDGVYLDIEVKYRGQVDERDIKGISPVKRYFVLSREEVGWKGDCIILPLDIFLSLLFVSERII